MISIARKDGWIVEMKSTTPLVANYSIKHIKQELADMKMCFKMNKS